MFSSIMREFANTVLYYPGKLISTFSGVMMPPIEQMTKDGESPLMY
jgi:hypothetical protein